MSRGAYGFRSVSVETRKALVYAKVTVPQTDTGERGEYPQVCEITLAKELGKFGP